MLTRPRGGRSNGTIRLTSRGHDKGRQSYGVNGGGDLEDGSDGRGGHGGHGGHGMCVAASGKLAHHHQTRKHGDGSKTMPHDDADCTTMDDLGVLAHGERGHEVAEVPDVLAHGGRIHLWGYLE